MKYCIFKSPFGQLEAVFDNKFLYFLGFQTGESLTKRLMTAQQQSLEPATITWEQVQKLDLKPLKGTPFQRQVWQVLQSIPKGQTRSYRDIALSVGNPQAVRAVGAAIGRNPISILIPCHRVIRSNGGLGGYHWGIENKIKLLKAEGVLFES